MTSDAAKMILESVETLSNLLKANHSISINAEIRKLVERELEIIQYVARKETND